MTNQAERDATFRQLEDLRNELSKIRPRLALVEGDVRSLKRSASEKSQSASSCDPDYPLLSTYQENGRQQAITLERDLSDNEQSLSPIAAPVPPNPFINELVVAFNQMVERPTIDGRNDFYARYGASSTDGVSLTEGAALFAWIPLSAIDGAGLLVPGHGPVRDWAKSYRGDEAAGARMPLDRYFDIEPGLTLQLIEPASARIGDDGRIGAASLGRLSGR